MLVANYNLIRYETPRVHCLSSRTGRSVMEQRANWSLANQLLPSCTRADEA
jgi:hypothetical protein